MICFLAFAVSCVTPSITSTTLFNERATFVLICDTLFSLSQSIERVMGSGCLHPWLCNGGYVM